jgi:hypothetical protein
MLPLGAEETIYFDSFTQAKKDQEDQQAGTQVAVRSQVVEGWIT